MMGVKAREFGPIDAVTLEDLVRTDSFYRHLERGLAHMTGNVFGKRIVPNNDNELITRPIDDRGVIAAS